MLNLPIIGSIHAPILLDTLMDKEKLRPPFQFLVAWCRDLDSERVIQEDWKIEINGYQSYQLVVRRYNVKRAQRNGIGRSSVDTNRG